VDVQQHDKTFVTTFLLVLGFLGAFTFAIIVIANVVSAKTDDDTEAQARARLEERIKPVGQVITDEKMLLAAAPAPAAAKREPMSGKQVVDKVCGACHNTGLLNAPKTGDKGAWAARGNLAALTASAIKGKNAMPPRGGDPSLSDEEVKAAIQEMTK
jgi:cytochrome c5